MHQAIIPKICNIFHFQFSSYAFNQIKTKGRKQNGHRRERCCQISKNYDECWRNEKRKMQTGMERRFIKTKVWFSSSSLKNWSYKFSLFQKFRVKKESRKERFFKNRRTWSLFSNWERQIYYFKNRTWISC